MKKYILSSVAVLAVAGAVFAKANVKTIQFKYKNGVQCLTGTFPNNVCPTGEALCQAQPEEETSGTFQLYTISGSCQSGEEIKRSAE